MDKELAKSLTSLIDETISEIEDLKKSRFSAAEVKVGDDKSIDGRSASGDIAKDEDKDKDKDKDKDDDKDDDKDADKDDVEKGVLDEAEKEKIKKEEAAKAEIAKEEAAKAEIAKEEAAKAEPAEGYDIKKSLDEQESLMKSYIDQKIAPLEGQLKSILEAVTAMGDAPVDSKGVTANMVPLQKSN